ncbi:hypothetical protein R3P38DRAFT_3175265 [Favolaschia claudopus]|uniref:Uncharacterized protein n=1 Tax=Favolaschia claudopus TaxID=2862362 RepID=A0AAW0DD44_9AGAR
MYDRHMRRNLGFHTLDGDTMTGVVHPQMYGMPVPAFIFMDRTKHSFVPVMASSWMYPEKVASVKQPPSVLPHPSPQVLSVKPQNFINGLNRDAENSPTKSEGLRHPFLHERPTNVVTVMGDLRRHTETAGALWDKINKHPVGRKPSILAIARMAKVCWILCPTTTDAIVAVGIFGLLLKDDALIRFETNQATYGPRRILSGNPSQISPPPNMTTQAHTLQSNLPDNSPSPQPPTSTVVDDMVILWTHCTPRLHDNGRSKPPPSSSVDDMWGAGSNLDGNASNARQGQSVDLPTAPNPGSSTVEQEVFTFGQHNAGAPVAGDMWGAGSNLEGNASTPFKAKVLILALRTPVRAL